MPTPSPPSGQTVLWDPIFQAVLRDGSSIRLTLPGILSAVDDGNLLDLSGMKAHQRAATVTVLAIIRTALRRYIPSLYDSSEQLSAKDYDEAWVDQLGLSSARVCAPYNEVAFFQPPLLVEPHLPKSLDAVDVSFSDVRHEIKGSGDTGDAEAWIYALWSGMMRIYVKDNVSGSRWGVTMILPGDGLTIGSEILHLSRAYEDLSSSESVLDRYSEDAVSAADHLVFIQPIAPDQKQLALKSVAFPFAEAPRAVRLYQTGVEGVYRAMQMTLAKPRIDSKAYGDVLLDPHVAVSDEKPYKLIKGRRFDYRFVMNSMFAADKKQVVSIPHTLTFDRSYRSVRICGLSTDQGKTTGYFERTVSRTDTEIVIGQDDDRLTALAEKGMDITSKVQGSVVYAASAMMSPDKGEITKAIASDATDLFRSIMDEKLPRWVLERGSKNKDDDTDHQTYADITVPSVYEAVSFAERSAPSSTWLTRARAWLYVTYALSFSLALKDYKLMKTQEKTQKRGGETPEFARGVMGALKTIYGMMKADPTIPVSLRTMPNDSKSIQMVRLASELPIDLFDQHQSDAADVILRGLGYVPHVFRDDDDQKLLVGFGAVLARSGFPEPRIDRLISSSGETLHGLVTEAWTFAESKGIERADWSSIASLVLADAVGKERAGNASDWARMKIATEFILSQAAVAKSKDKGKDSSAKEPGSIAA